MAENPLAPGPLQKPPSGKKPTTSTTVDTRTPYEKALDQQKKDKKKIKKNLPGDSITNPAQSREGLAPGKFYVNPETGDIMQVVGPGFYDSVVLRAKQAAVVTGEENTLKSLQERLSKAKIAYEPFDPIKRPSGLQEPENVPFEGKLASKKSLKAIIDSIEKEIKKISSTVSPLKDEAYALREELAQDEQNVKNDAPGKRLTPQERAAKLQRAQELELQATTIEKTGDIQATKPTLPPTTTTTTTTPTTVAPSTTTTVPRGTTTTTQPQVTTTTTVEPTTEPVATRPTRGIGATAAEMRAAGLKSPRSTKPKTPATSATTVTTGGTTAVTTGGGTGGGTGGAKTGKGGKNAAQVQEDQLRKQYPGYSWVFDLGPEFADTKNLLTQMLVGPENGGITYERFQALWPQSSYFRDARVVGQKRKILERYGDVQLPTGSMAKLISDSISFQYDDTDLDNAFYNEVFKRDPLTGQLVNKESATSVLNGTASTTIKNYANSMFTAASDQDIEDILTGKMTRETYQSRLRTVAKNVYRNWADVLDDPNMTMEEIVKPWKNMAAQVLEMDPSQIDMTKAQFAAAYNGTDASGKPAAMSLGDWYVKLRTDPTYNWKNTTGAKQEARDIAFKLASAFGKIL